jgi:hypothetical protein
MAVEDTADHAEPVVVGAFATQGEAEVAQALLEGYGIESMVADAIEGGAIPVEGEDGVALLVRHADAADAAAILAAPPADPDPDPDADVPTG